MYDARDDCEDDDDEADDAELEDNADLRAECFGCLCVFETSPAPAPPQSRNNLTASCVDLTSKTPAPKPSSCCCCCPRVCFVRWRHGSSNLSAKLSQIRRACFFQHGKENEEIDAENSRCTTTTHFTPKRCRRRNCAIPTHLGLTVSGAHRFVKDDRRVVLPRGCAARADILLGEGRGARNREN